eukprot:1029874-Rhodomonas_salina.2
MVLELRGWWCVRKRESMRQESLMCPGAATACMRVSEGGGWLESVFGESYQRNLDNPGDALTASRLSINSAVHKVSCGQRTYTNTKATQLDTQSEELSGLKIWHSL